MHLLLHYPMLASLIDRYELYKCVSLPGSRSHVEWDGRAPVGSTITDDNGLLWEIILIGWRRIDQSHHIHPIHHSSHDHMLPIKLDSWVCGDEELGAVRVGPHVRHRDDPSRIMGASEILVIEVASKDTLSAQPVALYDVAALNDEARDDAMEARALRTQNRSAHSQQQELNHKNAKESAPASGGCVHLHEHQRILFNHKKKPHPDSLTGPTPGRPY